MRHTYFLAAIVGTLLISSPSEAREVCFKVENMTCKACSITIKVAAKKLEEVKTVNVDQDKKTVKVEIESGKVTDREVEKKITDAGYPASRMPSCDTKTLSPS